MFAFNCLPVGSGDFDFHAAVKAAEKVFPNLTVSTAFQIDEHTAWEMLAELAAKLEHGLDAKLDSSGKRLADPSFVLLPNHHVLYLKAGLYYIVVWNTEPMFS